MIVHAFRSFFGWHVLTASARPMPLLRTAASHVGIYRYSGRTMPGHAEVRHA